MRNTARAALQTTVTLIAVTASGCPGGGGVLLALDGATARQLLEALATAVAAAEAGRWREPLTPRENEVLLALSQGKGYGQIAAELVIELETVRTHARRVRRKLGVATSRELHGRVTGADGTGSARGGAAGSPRSGTEGPPASRGEITP